MIFAYFFSICSCRSCLAHLRLSGGGLSLQNRFSSRDSALSPWRKKSCAATAQLLSRLMVACLWTTKVFRCHVLRLPAIEDFLPCSHFRPHNTGMYCVLALTEESHVVRSWMVLLYPFDGQRVRFPNFPKDERRSQERPTRSNRAWPSYLIDINM